MIEWLLAFVVFILFLIIRSPTSDPFLHAGIGLACGSTTFLAWNKFRSYRTAPERVPKPRNPKPIPDTAQPYINRLFALGFHRIGEAENGIRGKTYPIWVLSDQTGTTCAEITVHAARVYVEFSSVYLDKAFVETFYIVRYPAIPLIQERNFRHEGVRTSLQDAYKRHQQVIEEFALDHGEARPILTIQDYVEAQAVYRTRYIRRALRSAVFWGTILPTLWCLSCLLLALILWVGETYFDTLYTPPTSTYYDLFGSLRVLLPLVGYFFVAAIGVLYMGRSIYASFQNKALSRRASV